MATVLITGGTGLVGSVLSQELIRQGYSIIVLTRHAKQATKDISYAQWDLQNETIDEAAIAKADHIIHLAGANVAEGRWTEKRKKEIVDSRLKSSELLVKTLQKFPNKIGSVVSASAIGWYGADLQVPNPKPFVETDLPAIDFLGTTCQQWEASILPAAKLVKRLVILRTGIVLSNEGGAYAELKKPLRFGIASILGSGKQMISWIHIADLVGMYVAAIENDKWQGAYNAVAPNPVTNQQLVTQMAKTKGGFHVTAHMPELILKTMLGEMSIEVLKSVTVSSKKTEQGGYNFIFPTIETALYNLKG